ncbi:MAG: DUF4065 domain-containing protein [Clostridium sp.]|nr:DUF4065 domain-containing protein [Clostridium sp.]
MIKKILEYCVNSCYHIYKMKVVRVKNMERYSALDIATWFIYKTNAEKKENQAINDTYEVYEGLTHLKLQKLLYYAQGISLSLNNNVLFNDQIEAWNHGPVIKSVFEKFCKKGRNEITIEDSPSPVDVIRKIEADTPVREALNMTYDNFAIYTAWQLRNMTHEKGTPWYQTYKPGKNKKISVDLIKKYFDTYVME